MRWQGRGGFAIAMLAVLPGASYSFGPQVHRQHHEWRERQQQLPKQQQHRYPRRSSPRPRCGTSMALAPVASSVMNNVAEIGKVVYTSQISLPSLQMLTLKVRAGFLVLAAKMKLATALMSTCMATPLVGAASASGGTEWSATVVAAAHSLPFGIEWSAATFQALPLEAHGALGAMLFILLQNVLVSIGESTASRRRSAASAAAVAAAVAAATRAVPPGANAAAFSNVYWAAKMNRRRGKKPAAAVVAEERAVRGDSVGGGSGGGGGASDAGNGRSSGTEEIRSKGQKEGAAKTLKMRGGAAVVFTHHVTHGISRLREISKLQLSSQIEDWQRRVFYSTKDQ